MKACETADEVRDLILKEYAYWRDGQDTAPPMACIGAMGALSNVLAASFGLGGTKEEKKQDEHGHQAAGDPQPHAG